MGTITGSILMTISIISALIGFFYQSAMFLAIYLVILAVLLEVETMGKKK